MLIGIKCLESNNETKGSKIHFHDDLTLVDYSNITIAQVKMFFKIVDKVKANPEDKIVIHCAEGLGRSGTMLCTLYIRSKFMHLNKNDLLRKNLQKTANITLLSAYTRAGSAQAYPLVKESVDVIRANYSKQAIETEGHVETLNQLVDHFLKTEKIKK